ncbi:bifunctional riboflavin kinase/FMN adenylyltransferase [Clostridium botulinum CFSAN002367]|nr:bifunctional riboflavin kinase/FMN adenylyltransferase [Clostridium botulinum CFSAN002367]
MIVMEDNFSTKLEDKTYIALGSFDGLHKGHMKLIKEIKKWLRIMVVKVWF